MLKTPQPLVPELLEQALQALVAHHDALRLRFRRDGESSWRQRHAGGGRAARSCGCGTIRSPRRWRRRRRACRSPTDPLVRAVLSDQRLCVIVHHLVVDGVSWRILLEDLQLAYRQLAAGNAVDLGARSTSFQRWSEELGRTVRAGALDEELPHWLACTETAAPLPIDARSRRRHRGDGADGELHARSRGHRGAAGRVPDAPIAPSPTSCWWRRWDRRCASGPAAKG